jgi:hypothetical protein
MTDGTSDDGSFIERNDRERQRMRRLVDGLDEESLAMPVNPHWTVAGVLGHIAFWDTRALALAEKLERGEPWSADDAEPDDVDWINDASRLLIHAIPPVEAARVAIEIADATDAKMAQVPADALWPADPDSPIQPVRALQRGEHLDDVEEALRRAGRLPSGGTAT